MITIKLENNIDKEIDDIIDNEFNKFAKKNGIVCDYEPFTFIARENEHIVGILTGHSYYNEVHIGDLIVKEEYRNKKIGTKLVNAVEEYYKDKRFRNINLTTYGFQAPTFYEKCGFKIEFIREDKENLKLTKYFLIKYIQN